MFIQKFEHAVRHVPEKDIEILVCETDVKEK